MIIQNLFTLQTFLKKKKKWILSTMLLQLKQKKEKFCLEGIFLKKIDLEKQLNPGSKVKINGKEFEVVGISKKTGNFIINGAIIMLNNDMESLLDLDNEIDLIVAQVEDT